MKRSSQAAGFIDKIEKEIARVIVGQHYMISRLLIGLLSNGHVLLEGVPGLAKTLTINHFLKLFMQNSAGYNLPLTCYLPTLSEP